MATQFDFNYLPIDGSGAGKTELVRANNPKGHNTASELLGIAQGASQLINNSGIIQAKQASDTHKGWVDGVNFATSIEGKSGLEQKEIIDAKFKELGNTNDAYTRGFLSPLDTAYTRAVKLKEEERVSSVLNTTSTSYLSTLKTSPEYANPDDYVTMVSQSYSIPKSQVRDAIYTSSSGYYTSEVSKSQSPEELNNILGEWEQVKSHVFNSNNFRGSRAKKFQSLVRASDSNMNNAITAKQTEFKMKAQSTLSTLIDNEYPVPSSEVSGLLDMAYGSNKLTLGNKTREWDKNYKTYQEKRFTDTLPITNRPTAILANNKVAKEAWEDRVTKASMSSLLNGDSYTFVDVLMKNQEDSKVTGDALYQMFISASNSQDLGLILNNMYSISKQPNGASVLNSTIGHDRYAEMLTTMYVSQALGKTPIEAREYIHQASINTSKPSWDDDTYKDVQEYSVSLGSLGQPYKTVMESINKIDGRAAKVNEPIIRKYFEGLLEDKRGVTYNTFAGVNPIDDTAIDPDNVYDTINTTMTELYGTTPKEISMLPNGEAYVKDKWGGSTALFNVQHFIDKDLIESKQEAKDRVNTVPIIDSIIGGVAISGEAIGDTLSEAGTNTLLSIKNMFSTETDNINQTKLSPEDKQTLGFAKEKNKHIVNSIDKALIKKSRKVTFGGREGQINPKHLAYKNNNPGNIRPIKGITFEGTEDASGEFIKFKNPSDGMRALYLSMYAGVKDSERGTIKTIMEQYAPRSENDTDKYINFIEQYTGIDKDAKLTPSNIDNIMTAIIQYESSLQNFKQDDFFDGIKRAKEYLKNTGQ